MINSNETMVPDFLLDHNSKSNSIKHINSADTIPPDGYVDGKDEPLRIDTGATIAGSYILNSSLSNDGKQAEIFLAKKWGKNYVVKVYKNGWHQNARIKDYLLSVNHPNIAPVIECGDYNGNYFEIYEYYNQGTLEEENSLSVQSISKIIVPSINEGLRELHKNGILHCDIKPSNLFYSNEKDRIIIGDCGISGFTNNKGNMIDSFRGTPEYAPPVRSHMWIAEYSPAYDYGAFGLVLCRLVLGYSLFDGCSEEAIAKAWLDGIKLPSAITGRIETLIKGLINPNENERWNYNEVKRWCEGEYMRTKGRGFYSVRQKRKNEKKPLVFGRFDNDILKVSNLNQLAKAIRGHWEQATRVIKRNELIDFLRQFIDEKPDIVSKTQILAREHDVDAAVFKLLCLLDPNSEDICFCGEVYISVSDYIAHLYSGDITARKFISSGLLSHYLREQNANKHQVDKLEQLIKSEGANNMTAIATICYAIQSKRSIEVFGVTVKSLEDLIKVIADKPIEQISSLIEMDSFSAWLFNIGYDREVKIMAEIGAD